MSTSLSHCAMSTIARCCAPLLLCACASTANVPEASKKDAIEVVSLTPTVRGVAVVVSDDAVTSTADATSGVSWSSFRNAGGSVLFFADRTVCIREGDSVGMRISGDSYDASTADGATMIRIDRLGAEARALETGNDLENVATWLLLGVRSANETSRTAASKRGAQIARQMVDGGFPTPIKIAAVSSTNDDVSVLLLPQNAASSITEQLRAIVVGPAASPYVFDVLLDGPETQQDVADSVRVRVWRGDDSRSFTPSFGAHTEADRRWLDALQATTTAIDRGCSFPPAMTGGTPVPPI